VAASHDHRAAEFADLVLDLLDLRDGRVAGAERGKTDGDPGRADAYPLDSTNAIEGDQHP